MVHLDPTTLSALGNSIVWNFFVTVNISQGKLAMLPDGVLALADVKLDALDYLWQLVFNVRGCKPDQLAQLYGLSLVPTLAAQLDGKAHRVPRALVEYVTAGCSLPVAALLLLRRSLIAHRRNWMLPDQIATLLAPAVVVAALIDRAVCCAAGALCTTGCALLAPRLASRAQWHQLRRWAAALACWPAAARALCHHPPPNMWHCSTCTWRSSC